MNSRGFRNMIQGYQKGFYEEAAMEPIKEDCYNDITIDNIITFSHIIDDPFSLLDMKNIRNDIDLFAEGAEIIADISGCNFEQFGVDTKVWCEADSEGVSQCSVSNMVDNVSTNMIFLMGKLTKLAEMMPDFPSNDPNQYYDQMNQIGLDAGTFVRVVYGYKTPSQQVHNESTSRTSGKNRFADFAA
jgi:hypothetical protein